MTQVSLKAYHLLPFSKADCASVVDKFGRNDGSRKKKEGLNDIRCLMFTGIAR